VSVKGVNTASEVGSVRVWTTEHRGYTPEEIAERAMARILYIGDQSHPLLRQQAHAFREQLYVVLVQYLREAQESDRLTVCEELRKLGLDELAILIKDI